MHNPFDLPKTLSQALTQKGYSELTPVQVAVTQPELGQLDLLVSAQTGSGKTVGFGLAIAPDLLDGDGRFDRPASPLALVIAPTRELAMQVQREFDWLFSEAGIVTASAVGGMDARAERRAIERGAHVIVATPGRLRDHVSRGVIDLSDLRAVVLDEADEMLDMGFSEDLEFILDHTPENRRTLLFSATVPRGIAKLAQTYQKDNARRIEVGNKDAQHADISYLALSVAPSDIEKAIINLLRFHDAQTAIIFANTRSMVARLTAKFSNRGFSVVSLSGELSQTERTHALQALRDGRARVCIATDVAARGIDLPRLELVIHADLPSNAESLLHRSGRTGRAGRKGTSVLIVPGRQRSKAQRLLKSAKLEAEWGTPPSAEEVLARDEERLMSDPGWGQSPSAEEQAFAQRLLQEHSAEKIAAAFLRLYRERNSAPEILGDVPEPGARKKRDASDFGPSTWFSLSLGRKQRAEPRWLLPMLCRNAGISKDAIGAIRVQYQETFVEILTDAVPAMKNELGPELDLEQGARLTELPGVPDFDASPKGLPAAPKTPRADRKKDVSRRDSKPAVDPNAAESEQSAKKPSKRQDNVDKPQSGKPKRNHGKSQGNPEKKTTVKSNGIETKRRKNAADPSKPMGSRKERAKGRQDGDKPKRFKVRAGKGPDARPMRKGSRKK
ncbi:DEAD/DEAH box helicase [Ruegeria sp. HKCCD7318]|uniref:DEAD/DEAH box helicase n=1 Tax=Ruegeria sp. HKCCD7318 TaxID=2683014 RepID=UPI001492AB3B|nr:DEAD/DEAH box helicase [Ruegeria sp. HKCCD7318]NOE34560.1 DEAD/DEAH box helicase [Ruegeria sp. HKCCD7318]